MLKALGIAFEVAIERQGTEHLECDICGKHRPLAYAPEAAALVCSKCINRAGGLKNIDLFTILVLKDALELDRIKSRTNNLSSLPTCPVVTGHKDIKVVGRGMFYCLDCQTIFTHGLGKVFFWHEQDEYACWSNPISNPKNISRVEFISSSCTVHPCTKCGDVMHKHDLNFTWDKDDELIRAYCNSCMK